MGVPKFYRWLSERFPQINTVISDSTLVPEFDNMYLDMNGIIHACSHPNDADLSKTISLKDMMLGIFRYIDRMVSEIAKPKKILFMAIDGCAPRAKMNQQRARRFRSAQEQVANITKARDNGEDIDLENLFDSNCITPGTEFMDTVGEHIKWFIRKKIKEDPIWQRLEVVFSGHDVPGEGEHKIMQFIRELKSRPNYKPNQRHCMYGADADLIMLGLATHEPHFTLLREVVEFNFRGPNANKTVMRQTKDVKFQLLHISVLREYIELDMSLGCARSVDKERLIDDFIFLTFLVGNDFLPHLPTLDIGEHAFDVIFTAYKQLLRDSDGYLVTNGELRDLPRLEALFQKIGKQEQDILANREVLNNKNKSRSRLSKEQKQSEAIDKATKDAAYDEALAEALSLGLAISDADKLLYTEVESDFIHNDDNSDVLEQKESAPALTSAKDYRGRYYFDKFKIIPSTANVESQEFLHTLCTHYFEGLTWCLAYYIKGCISWTWYYPYNYGPMLIDMKNLNAIEENMNFTLGRPFFPFQQLLGCLPPASARLLPKPYQFLMTNEVSPLLKYYPLDFGVDQDGKKNPWEAVVILPFIDETDLLTAEAHWCNESTLSPAEKKRNTFGSILLYRYDPQVTSTYTAFTTASGIHDINQCSSTCIEIAPQYDPRCSFAPVLEPGTTLPISGFPSLGVLRISKVETKELKLNCFGSDSKYKTVKLQLSNTPYDPETLDLRTVVGKTVYVNYPCMHEAFVIGASTYDEKYELAAGDRDPNVIRRADPQIVVKRNNGIDMEKFKTMAKREESRYLKGCGIPGLGGVDIGTVDILLHVVVLQGMKVDPVSGAKRKFYGTQEAIMPYQTTLSVLPMVDNRFIESISAPVPDMFPYACKVVGVAGQFTGVDGIVVGPHNAENMTPTGINEGTSNRYIDVEMNLRPPEPNFSSIIADSMNEKYYPSREICKSVGVTPGVLGRILGALYVGNDRINVGLDMRKNGEYYLPGYTRATSGGNGNGSNNQNNKGGKKGGKVDSVWSRNDSVTVVGSNMTDDVEKEAAAGSPQERTNWEYSAKVVQVLLEYKTHFPEVMTAMMDNPEEKKFSTKAIFGGDNHEEKFMKLLFWLKQHPVSRIPRAPMNTQTLPVEIVAVIENTTMQVNNFINQRGLDKAKVTKMPLNAVIKETVGNSGEVVTTFNRNLVPTLGDRVVSINALGVPFGQRGTVTAIHSSTGYVEVLFDEEFVGGKPIQGCMSLFKGRLCPWRHLLCLRDVGAPQAKSAGKGGSAGGVQTKKKEASQSNEKEEANTKVTPPPVPETIKAAKPESKGRAALLQAAKGEDGSTGMAKSSGVDAELLDYQYVPKPATGKSSMPNKAKKAGNGAAKGTVSKEAAVDMLKKAVQTKIVPSLLVKKKADSK